MQHCGSKLPGALSWAVDTCSSHASAGRFWHGGYSISLDPSRPYATVMQHPLKKTYIHDELPYGSGWSRSQGCWWTDRASSNLVGAGQLVLKPVSPGDVLPMSGQRPPGIDASCSPA